MSAKNSSKVDVSVSLLNAVREGDLRSVKKLINSHGLSFCACSIKDYALLFVAITLGHVEIAKFLLQKGATVDCESALGDTLLHLVIRQNNLDLVRLLLKKNARIDAQNGQGETPLHSAVKQCAEMTKVGHNKSVLTDAQNGQGETPLHSAVKQCAEMTKVGHNKSVLTDAQNCQGETLLHMTVTQRCEDIVKLLLNENAPIDAQNCQGETALHLAVKQGCEEIVRLLLNKNASLTAQSKEGSTPLFLAIEGGHEDIAVMLLKHASSKFKTSTRGGKSLLDRILFCNATVRDKIENLIVSIVTCKNGPNKIVDELVDHGFILSRKYVDESFILTVMKTQHTKLIGSIVRITNSNDAKYFFQLLHTELKNKHKENDSIEYFSCLNIPVKSKHEETVEMIFDHGFDVNVKNKSKKGDSYTQDDKWVEVLRLLLVHGVAIKEAPGLLHSAVEKGLVEVCKILIENGVNVNSLNEFGETPLYLSCKIFNTSSEGDEIVELLLNNGADVNMQIKSKKEYWIEMCISAFHRAVISRRKEAIFLFLNFGVDIDLQAEDGSTSLHWACQDFLSTDIVDILCKNGANVEARRGDGCTPLHLAGSAGVVKVLLKYNADIDARGPNNETPLLRATQLEIVSVLLDSGCDINAENKKGETAMDVMHREAKSTYDRLRDNAGSYFLVRDFEDIPPYEYIEMNKLEIISALKRHATKLAAAGLSVSEKNFDLFESLNRGLDAFKLKCEKEVNRMTNKQLNPQFTLYDVLVNGKNLSFAKNKPLMRILKSFNFDSFPIYRSLITRNLRISEFKLELVRKGQNSLDLLIKTRRKLNGEKYLAFPGELLEYIVLFLSIGEFRNLISCGEALKRQLGL